MNELIEAIKTRLSSPILGYFGLTLFAFNWKAFFYLIAQDDEVLGRIQFFEENTTWSSLFLWPLLFAIVFATLYPWLSYVLASLTAKPFELRDMLQARSEHKLIMAKKQLEEARSGLLANAELELIERAKRDEEVDELRSEELKNKIKTELDELRAQRDSLTDEGKVSLTRKRHKELMDIAGTYRSRANESLNSVDRDNFNERARDLENEAHRVIVASISASS